MDISKEKYMDTKRMFDEYFDKYRDLDEIYLLMGMGDSDGGREQLLFDIRSYCMIHRLFVEEINEHSCAALRLFRFPAVMPAYRERTKRILTYDWSMIWIKHLEKLSALFESDIEKRKTFIWYVIGNAVDWNDWINGLEDSFVKESAKECFGQLAEFLQELCRNVTCVEELMKEYREDGFTPDLKCYQSLEKMLNEIGV